METRGRWLVVSFVLMGLGWLTSGYLLYRVFQLRAHRSADVCSALFGRSCDETLLDPQSWQLGVPLPAWGLLYFVVIGFLLSLGSEWSLNLAKRLTEVGVGASLVFVGVILSGMAHLCVLCLCIHGINCALGFTVHNIGAPSPQVSRSWHYASLVGFIILGLVGQGTVSLYSIHSSQVDPETIIAQYRDAPLVDIDFDPASDHLLGSSEAPVRLIVFNSFQCPSCQLAARALRQLREHFGDQLCVVFKHFPLSSKCNPSVPTELQTRACAASWAAEAAGKHGRFWEYHDALYASDLRFEEETLVAMAGRLGIDVDLWNADRSSAETLAKVSADINEGRGLKITGTPTVFLNDRGVPSASFPALALLIKHVLDN